MGFAKGTTGGKAGRIYVVTDNSDDSSKPKPGTLRYGVIQKEPLWIIFATSMNIRLTQELIMQSDKTIDGRGVNVHIANGAGIMIQYVKNVIIHGLRIHDIHEGSGGMIRDGVDHIGIRTKSDGDGISIFGSSNIWVDHVSMWRCYDGLVDAVEGSTAVTISNSHFTDHNEVMLFGASDSSSIDQRMQITVAFNHFGKRLIQRMPRCRWGFIHVVNNDYTHWNMYAIGGSQHPTIISQGNRFIAPPDQFKKEITKRDYAPESVWKQWTWRSQGDLLMNGAFFVESGDPDWTRKHIDLFDGISSASGDQVTWITRKFFKCPKPKIYSCGYWKWKDEVFSDTPLTAIKELVAALDVVKVEMDKLREEVAKLEALNPQVIKVSNFEEKVTNMWMIIMVSLAFFLGLITTPMMK
ncbi:hypothetical protein K7X08_019254 [Anisodus acutangulus]|uniref:Pectate lyase n=1 Tax=Anisodus acutangulus TaxID=402998 RepID=A0A9Q1RQG1_9SOLA|nr:hypothetical protein K7X08_019254 [Anisodus acutangulus]